MRSGIATTIQVGQFIARDVLTSPELIRLAELESIIARGIKTFVEVGSALVEVRDSRLYKSEFSTFEEYCGGKWNITRQYANLMISAAEVVNTFSSLPDPPKILPANERQARPLTKLPAEVREKAWDKAIEDADGKQPTQKQVERAAAKFTPPPAPPKPPLVKPDSEEVMELKRSGVIPDDVTVKIEMVGGEEREPGCDDDDPMPEVEATEEGWLKSLPVRAKLPERQQLKFDEEALCYRRSESIRLKFSADLQRIINAVKKPNRGKLGPWTAVQVGIAKSKHPKDWHVCQDCFGEGFVKQFGICTSCRGDGFGVHLKRD